MAKFGMAFNIGSTNEERIEAFEMYQNAFNAKKISEMKPPGSSDIHIVAEICGIAVLLAPGFDVVKNLNNPLCCEVHFDNESDIRNAYEFLHKDSLSCSIEGPYPWAKVLALVTDKFGIGWALYFNE